MLKRAAATVVGTLSSTHVAPKATAVSLPGLRYWRVQRAMLQQQLADRAEITLRSVQRLEAGGRAGLDTVRALAEALGVEPSALLNEPPE